MPVELASGTSINNVTKSGIYSKMSSVNTVTDKPENTAFILVVMKVKSNRDLMQIFLGWSNKVWIRVGDAIEDTWETWKSITFA